MSSSSESKRFNSALVPLLIFINLFSNIATEKICGDLEIKLDLFLRSNMNLSESISDFGKTLMDLNRKFEQALLDQQLEYREKNLILQEKEIKLEQQIFQNHQQVLQLQKELYEKLEKLEEYEKSQETIVLRRKDGSVDFLRTWNDYKKGFGDSAGEFFIGLDRLHQLTNSGRCQLIIILEDWENERRYAKYDNFIIGSESEQYKLHSLGHYTGTAGDDFSYNLGQKFTTIDRDNDQHGSANCAVLYKGAWWHKSCYKCNLFGPYKKGQVNVSELGHIVQWHAFKGNVTSLKFAEMKIRVS
ncbi:ryncolin-1-like [Haematobia irritans]|uniref:ryncolin-1-like n=1 Tax=Haematobia irritans TaxID=7368 RepID=UPI003F4F799F